MNNSESSKDSIRGNPNAPVIRRCFHTKRNALPKEYIERVSHCYELEYIPWGEGEVITEGEHLPAVAGTVFFRKPNMRIHGILPYSSTGILLDALPVEDLPYHSVFPTSHTIAYLFKEVYQGYLSGNPVEELRMKADVYNILYYLKNSENETRKVTESPAVHYHMASLEKLKRYIDQNLDRHLTLEEMAKHCSISPSFLCRLFKQAYGETVFSYLNRKRIQEARTLLIETEKPIKDICLSCGFANESYFYRAFRQTVHVTPTEFRRIHRQPFEDLSDD